jgi:DNA-binding XRE family transcriptional regulator
MKTSDKYIPNAMKYFWKIQPEPLATDDAAVEELCQYCNSHKDEQIMTLKKENEKLNKLVGFLKAELHNLELKTNMSEEAISIKEAIKEYSATPMGTEALNKAWGEQYSAWKDLVSRGKMSKIKYYRLISGINQHDLAKRLETKQPNIARIEKTGYQPNVDTLKKLAKIFSVKVEDLIEK